MSGCPTEGHFSAKNTKNAFLPLKLRGDRLTLHTVPHKCHLTLLVLKCSHLKQRLNANSFPCFSSSRNEPKTKGLFWNLAREFLSTEISTSTSLEKATHLSNKREYLLRGEGCKFEPKSWAGRMKTYIISRKGRKFNHLSRLKMRKDC